MITRSTRALRDILVTATTEARLRADPLLGNEHLLLALLHDPELTPLWGERRAVDGRTALAAIDADALRSAGVEPVALAPAPAPGGRRSLDLSSGARRTIDAAQRIAKARRARRVQARDLLQALLITQAPDVSRQLMHRLGIDPARLLDALTA